jgi:ribosomal protein L7/L12
VAAGRRWDVWLTGFTPDLKISAIKLVREVLNCGLAEAKTLVESVPRCLVGNTHRGEAEEVRQRLTASDRPAMTVLIRPAPVPSGAPRTYQPPPFFEPYLQEPRPGQRDELMRALEQFFQWTSPRTASLVLAGYLPYKLGRYQTEQQARVAVFPLERLAVIEMRHIDRPAVTAPPFLVRTPATLSKGGFEVLLLSYPRERKIAVIKAYRELTGCGLAEGKNWSEQERPLVVLSGADKTSAEHARDRFAEFGEVEVREGVSH